MYFLGHGLSTALTFEPHSALQHRLKPVIIRCTLRASTSVLSLTATILSLPFPRISGTGPARKQPDPGAACVRTSSCGTRAFHFCRRPSGYILVAGAAEARMAKECARQHSGLFTTNICGPGKRERLLGLNDRKISYRPFPDELGAQLIGFAFKADFEL